MTAGNQGAAYDRAQAELAKDPNNKDLQSQAARAKAELNSSLAKHGQREVR